MREILFRGKQTDNGEWIEGAYSPFHLNFGEREEKPHIIIISDDEDIDGLWCEVIPETVGQFTGLTDKNGKRIFEGDIVKAFSRYDTQHTYAITYRNGVFWFGVWNWVEFIDRFQFAVVIGNIYDNPELLGGENNGINR